MKLNKVCRNFVIILIVLSNVGCDQVSKSIVRKEIGSNEYIKVVSQHFTLMKVENTGAFLSLGSALPWVVKFLVLSLLPLLALLSGLYFLMSKNNLSRLLLTGVCFIIGGGLGNVYDRLVLGSVTDFMHIDFGLFQTGVFNMADVSVMLGTCLIFIDLFRKKSHPELVI